MYTSHQKTPPVPLWIWQSHLDLLPSGSSSYVLTYWFILKRCDRFGNHIFLHNHITSQGWAVYWNAPNLHFSSANFSVKLYSFTLSELTLGILSHLAVTNVAVILFSSIPYNKNQWVVYPCLEMQVNCFCVWIFHEYFGLMKYPYTKTMNLISKQGYIMNWFLFLCRTTFVLIT